MKRLMLLLVAVSALFVTAPSFAQVRQGVSLFDASERLSISAHSRYVWHEGEGADIFDSQPELRQEPELGLSLVWNLGSFLDANFGGSQGIESQRTRLWAGFTLVLVKPKGGG